MLNEKLASLLSARTEAQKEHAEKQEELRKAGKTVSNIQTQIANVFVEGFSGSNEDIAFMLDINNSSDAMYEFRSKFLKEKKLTEAGYFPQSLQYGIGVNLYNEEEDLRIAAKSLEELFPVIVPVVIKGWKGEEKEYTLVNLNISSVADYEKFPASLYLVKEGDLYQATTIERRHNDVVADWSPDIAEVLIKAKSFLESHYGYDADNDDD